MKQSDVPQKFTIPFAAEAAAGDITVIPVTPPGIAGRASLQLGFPPDTFQQESVGGTPPYGSDFNGILNQTSAWDRWVATGSCILPYDPTFQAAVSGYP